MVKEQWIFCRVLNVTGLLISHTLGSVSLMTITAISVDRLLALLMGLQCRQTVTLSYAFVTRIWIWATVGSVIYFHNYQLTLWVGHSIISTGSVTSVSSYIVNWESYFIKRADSIYDVIMFLSLSFMA